MEFRLAFRNKLTKVIFSKETFFANLFNLHPFWLFPTSMNFIFIVYLFFLKWGFYFILKNIKSSSHDVHYSLFHFDVSRHLNIRNPTSRHRNFSLAQSFRTLYVFNIRYLLQIMKFSNQHIFLYKI